MPHKSLSRAIACSAVLLFCHAIAFAGDTAGTGAEGKNTVAASGTSTIQQAATPNSSDIFYMETMYTGMSNISGILARGRQDSTYNDILYAHRFKTFANWDLRLGFEYSRYDFSGDMAPLPDHLQNFNMVIAYEYVVQDFPAVAIEMHPGFSYENNVTWRNFDMPIDAFTSMKLYKDKVFGIGGVEYDNFIWPPLSGFGGVIWLINDKTRLQAIIPRPALIFTPNDDWEYQIHGQIYGGGFRLDDTGRTPSTYKGAIVRYTFEQVGIEATYKKWKPFNIILDVGYNIEREYNFIHYGPDQKYRASGAPYVGLTFTAYY